MNFIQLEPASLTIGYVCGTLLCYYIMEMFHAKESDYDNESKKDNFYPVNLFETLDIQNYQHPDLNLFSHQLYLIKV